MVDTATLTAQRAIEHMLHGTNQDALGIDPLQVLNLAGREFVNAYPWRWLLYRNAFLAGRGNISITDGTWTESTKTLTSTGSFASYTFVDGDQIKVTGGTNAVARTYGIASRTSDDAIVLDASLSSTGGDLATGDIAATLKLHTLTLPSDFGSLHSIGGSDTLVNTVKVVDAEELLHLRAQWGDREDDTGAYSAAIVYVGDPPYPVLDVYPDFGSTQQDVFRIFYRQGWKRITQGSQSIKVPEFAHLAFLQLCRHVAEGWEDDDDMGLEERLAIWKAGPAFRDATRHDGRVQKRRGRMRGGWARRTPWPSGPNSLSSEVGGPT